MKLLVSTALTNVKQPVTTPAKPVAATQAIHLLSKLRLIVSLLLGKPNSAVVDRSRLCERDRDMMTMNAGKTAVRRLGDGATGRWNNVAE